MLDAIYTCQWCGRDVAISVDPAGGRMQEWIEDCEMCCRPNILNITIERNGHEVTIDSRREND